MMRKTTILLCALVVALHANLLSQVIVLDTLPANTPARDTLYLLTSANGWDTCSPELMFTVGTSGKLLLTLPSGLDSFEYKICRGSWLSVETNTNGSDVPGRYFAGSEGDTARVNVIAWRDLVPPRKMASTATRGVRFLPTIFEIPQLNRKRTIRLYLPPNYPTGGLFPVIYMHDGQNLFDNATSFAGEWKVDEILDSLYTYRGFSAIVVAIYNDGKERLNEYSPWRNDSLGMGGEGDKYVKFIVNTLKPFMDRHYRTLSGPENTAIVGSSMGGLISLYAALEHPGVFGKAAIFSPSLWFSPRLNAYLQKYRRRRAQRLYFLIGEREGERRVSDLNSTLELLQKSGFDDEYYLKAKVAPDGRHAEWFWSREFGDAVRYLFKF